MVYWFICLFAITSLKLTAFKTGRMTFALSIRTIRTWFCSPVVFCETENWGILKEVGQETCKNRKSVSNIMRIIEYGGKKFPIWSQHQPINIVQKVIMKDDWYEWITNEMNQICFPMKSLHTGKCFMSINNAKTHYSPITINHISGKNDEMDVE